MVVLLIVVVAVVVLALAISFGGGFGGFGGYGGYGDGPVVHRRIIRRRPPVRRVITEERVDDGYDPSYRP